jgi:hypothetical protein
MAVARLRLSLNEGSLLRRTVLHVVAFVVATFAFLALTSFLLVTVLKGLLPSEKDASSSSSDDDEAATTAPSASPRPRPPRKKRAAPAAAPAPSPTAEDE